jgi:Fe-S cluster biogenesis protein NfuA
VVDYDNAKAAAEPTLRQRVEAALEAHVLPYVRNHGGDVRVAAIDDDGTVTCHLEGACRGCPAAPVTVVAVIERALQAHVSPSLTVKAPQLSVSSYAVERIRRFYPDRVTAQRRGEQHETAALPTSTRQENIACSLTR